MIIKFVGKQGNSALNRIEAKQRPSGILITFYLIKRRSNLGTIDTGINVHLVGGASGALAMNGTLGDTVSALGRELGGAFASRDDGEQGKDEHGKPREVHFVCCRKI